MAERSQHRASEGQDAGSRAAPGDRKPEPTPGRRRRRDSRMAVASVRRWAWADPSPRRIGKTHRLKTCATRGPEPGITCNPFDPYESRSAPPAARTCTDGAAADHAPSHTDGAHAAPAGISWCRRVVVRPDSFALPLGPLPLHRPVVDAREVEARVGVARAPSGCTPPSGGDHGDGEKRYGERTGKAHGTGSPGGRSDDSTHRRGRRFAPRRPGRRSSW